VTLDRAGNLLGALALVLDDLMTSAVAEAAGESPSSATVLSALLQFQTSPSIDRLRRMLGLTPSGMVRLLDGLQERGLVRRVPGADRRTTAVSLTAKGRRIAAKVSVARGEVLTAAMQSLEDTERRAFEGLVEAMLVGIVMRRLAQPPGPAWTCRLCDARACGRVQGRCPVQGAAQGARRDS